MPDDRTTFFDTYGPLNIARTDGVITNGQAKLWDAADATCDGVSEAIGCYMFCIAHGKAVRPWYVGMTVAQGGLKAEAFTPHKLKIYNKVMDKKRGRPVLFLFPLMTPSERFAQGAAAHKKLIQWLERYLMMTAFARNPEIKNVRDMKFLRQVEVLGVLGKRPGRPYQQAADVRRALFGTSHRLDE